MGSLSAVGVALLRFIGFTVGLFLAGFVVYFAMNLLRTVLSVMFVSSRLSDPAYRGAERTAAASVSEGGTIQFFPPWLPSPFRLVWAASGVITLVLRYSLRVWWPILIVGLVLAWRR